MENQPIQHPRYSPEERKQIIGKWKQSGLSRYAFCRQHHLSYYSLMYWIKKKRTKGKTVSSGFIPIKINSRSAQYLPEGGQVFAQVESSGKRIQIYQRVTANFLKQLLR